jgi:hypothetical protein
MVIGADPRVPVNSDMLRATVNGQLMTTVFR